MHHSPQRRYDARLSFLSQSHFAELAPREFRVVAFSVGSEHVLAVTGKWPSCISSEKGEPLFRFLVSRYRSKKSHLLPISAVGSVYSWGCADDGRLGLGGNSGGDLSGGTIDDGLPKV